MNSIITSNAWIYYIGLAICAFISIIIYALGDQYSLAGFYDYNGHDPEMQKRTRFVKFLTFLMIGYIVFWAAIRNGCIDTRTYIYGYTHLDPSTKIFDVFKQGTSISEENSPLFLVYQIILRRLGISWHGYLASIAVFSGACVYYGISKYSDDVALSCFLFIASMNFWWLYNGIRQFIVISMFFASIRLITEKKFFRFFALVIIMYFIHSTAIILIPIFFIVNMKNWSYGIWICVFVTMAIVIIFPNRVNFWIDNAFSDYGYLEAIENDDGVNIFRVLVSMVTPFMAFIYRKELVKYNNPLISVMINASLITAGIYSIGFVTSGILIGRLALYTEMFNIILLPFIIANVVPKRIKSIVYFGCIVGFFMYFHLQVRNTDVMYTTDWFDGLNLLRGVDVTLG